MPITYSEFIKERNLKLELLKAKYKSAIKKPKKQFKLEVHSVFFKTMNDEYIVLAQKIAPHYNFLQEIMTEHNHDPSKKISDLFDSKIKEITVAKFELMLQDLILNEAMNLFFTYLNKKFEELKPQNLNESPIQSALKWNADNETELIQLIYALNKAGYISGNITKIVPEFASLMNFPLGKNWKINHSSSIHNRKDGYQVKLFEKLKEKYNEYCIEQITKVKSREK